MARIWSFTAALAALLLVASPAAADPAGAIRSPSGAVAGADFDAALAAADVVILGEIHDRPSHHRAQAEIIERLAAAGHPPAVVLEMLPASLQPAIDAYLAGGDADPDGFAAATAWEEHWFGFELYRPVIAAALAAGAPIIGADLDRDEKRALGRGGADALDEATRTRLGLDLPFGAALADDLGRVLDEAHCGKLPERAIPAMITVQRARDGAFAAALRAARAAHPAGPAVLIAGAGHARRDWGVPLVLRGLSPELAVVAVSFADAGARDGTVSTGADGEPLYDYVLSTAAGGGRGGDPCDGI